AQRPVASAVRHVLPGAALRRPRGRAGGGGVPGGVPAAARFRPAARRQPAGPSGRRGAPGGVTAPPPRGPATGTRAGRKGRGRRTITAWSFAGSRARASSRVSRGRPSRGLSHGGRQGELVDQRV